MTEIMDGPGGVFFASGINMVATMKDTSPHRPRLVDPTTFTKDYTPWGDDNLHPQNTIAAVEANDTLPAVIDFKVKAINSGGLSYGEKRVLEDGKEIFIPMYISEVDDFLSEIEHENYLHEANLDFQTHANNFTGFSKNLGGKIADLFSIDAAQCRLGLQEKSGRNKGKFTKIFTHADWEASASSKDATPYTALDPNRRVVQQIREAKEHQFLLPIRYQTRGRMDYARGPVDYLVASGWLDIAKSIPIWKKSVMENQLSIKYHLEVEKDYWVKRWSDWDKKTDKEKKEVKKDTYSKFIQFFKGAENAGNVLITDYHRAEHGSEEWGEWKVTLLSGKMWADGAYMEESVSSDAHIIRALGVDHTLINLTPGSGYSSGSGSDKRVAFNQHVLLTQPEQRRILRPFDYIADINGWHKYLKGDAKLRFWFKNTFIATLDHGKDTKEANTNDTRKT